MGRARRARRVAQAAAYGGGFGIAGIGALGALGYGVVRAEAAIARRVIGPARDDSPDDDGMYGGRRRGVPLELVVLGDSTAAGMGADEPAHTVGALLAAQVSAVARRPVRLTNVAVVGAESPALAGQVEQGLQRVPRPDVAVILIGANDVTHRIDRTRSVAALHEAVERLRDAGGQVVVGTCPDLGALSPIAQPLRTLVRRWSRDLAAAQTVAVVEAGGRSVSLGDLLGPLFAAEREMFSDDRFHPSSAGYARVADAMLPSVCVALGLRQEGELEQPGDWPAAFLAGRRPLAEAATRAVADAGTEVSSATVDGHRRGPLGRWARVLRRARQDVPVDGPDGPDGSDEPEDPGEPQEPDGDDEDEPSS